MKRGFMVVLEGKKSNYDDIRKTVVDTLQLNVVKDHKFIRCMVVEFDGDLEQFQKTIEPISELVVEVQVIEPSV